MAISLVGSPVSGFAIDGLNITLTLSAGLAAGDVVYVYFALSAAAGGGTSSSGWTQVGSTVDNTVRAQCFRKVMGSTPDTSIVLTGSAVSTQSSSAVSFALRGVNTTTPEDATSTTATGSSTNPNPPSITTVTNNAWVLAFVNSSNLDTVITVPTGYGNHVTNTSNDGSDTTIAGATIIKATAGAEDPPTWTAWATGTWCARTVAVRPSLPRNFGFIN